MYRILFIYLVFFVQILNASIDISKMDDGVDIVKYVKYYVDKNSRLSLESIVESNISYKNATEDTLGFGYNHKDTVWLRFELLNNTNREISKILEFDYVHIGEFELYDLKTDQSFLGGYNYQKIKQTTTTYPVVIKLYPNETRKYIIRARSFVTPVNIKLCIWDKDLYKWHQVKHQVILALFFGAIVALLLYNLFLFFFIRDKTYLYYCAYLFGMIVHTLYYTGFLNLYVLPGFYLKERYVADIFIYLLIIFIAPFVRNYLHLQKIAPKIDKLLVVLPAVITVVAIFKIGGIISSQIYILLYLFCAPLMIYIGVYALLLGVREAYYFVAGWTFMIVGMLLMALYTTGVLPLFVRFPYLLEIGYFLEAILFSAGLAARINTLKKQKADADARLIFQQKEEHKKLETKVTERTKELKKALDEKEILFKELHHRVKNNLQMVVSLLRLQSDRIEDKTLQNVLISAQNRINAMSNLHKLLYQQDNLTHIDTKQYFKQITDEIKENLPKKNIDIDLDIAIDLSIDQAVYCGLILNELISNAVKHAFVKLDGKITILLYQKNEEVILKVVDDGVGFAKDKKNNSLGLLLVKTLTTRQLKGKYEFFVNKGTHIVISFKKV